MSDTIERIEPDGSSAGPGPCPHWALWNHTRSGRETQDDPWSVLEAQPGFPDSMRRARRQLEAARPTFGIEASDLAQQWDEVPSGNAPGEWHGGNTYGEHQHDWAWGGDGTWDYCTDPNCRATRPANKRGEG